MNGTARSGALVFLLITWLVLSLVAGGIVWWGASGVAAVAPAPQTGQSEDGSGLPTGETDPAQPTQGTADQDSEDGDSSDDSRPESRQAQPTGGSSRTSTTRSSSPRPPRTSSTSSSSSSSSFDPPRPEYDYSAEYVLIIDTCHKTEDGITEDNCTYQELADRTAARAGAGTFEILDGADYEGLRDDAWAAVARGITWPTKQDAQSNCGDYGRSAGSKCYAKRAGSSTDL